MTRINGSSCQVFACQEPAIIGNKVRPGPYAPITVFYNRFCIAHRKIWVMTGRVTILTEDDPLTAPLAPLAPDALH